MAKKIKKRKKRSPFRIILTFFFILIIIGVSGIFAISRMLTNDINRVDLNKDDLGISEELNKNNNIVNIALFGIDTRNGDYSGARADTIMIGTLDKEHKKLKLTSILRDTYVEIPGRGMDKINHAYAYGGPELTIKTINQNFDMNITDYVTVNFTALEKIVDAVGGVEIDVKPAEINSLNHNMRELDRIEGITSKQVTQPGLQTLNGRQAVAYSRIRNVGNNDYERTARQRTVLQKIVSKVLNNRSLPQALSLIETLSPYIETSLSNTEMVSYASSVFLSGIKDMEDDRLPKDDYSKPASINGVSYIVPNTLVDNVSYLHNFIYEEEGYIPTSVVTNISNKMP